MAKVQTRTHQPEWKKVLHGSWLAVKWTLIAGLLGVGAFDLFRFLFSSEFFAIRSIEVQGCVQTREEEFVQLSDIALGGNLFRLPASRVAERIDLHPWVEAARVVRVLPDTVRIVIYERRPLAAINSQFDGQVYGIDSHRVLLPDLARHAPDSATGSACFDLPILTGLPAEQIFPGNQLNDDRTRRAIETLLLLQTLDPGLLVRMSEIHIDEQGQLTLYPLERAEVVYLGKENLQKRAWRLVKVWNYLDEHDIVTRYIDCRFDGQGVVTRPENMTLEKWNSLPLTDRNLFLADSGSIDSGGMTP